MCSGSQCSTSVLTPTFRTVRMRTTRIETSIMASMGHVGRLAHITIDPWLLTTSFSPVEADTFLASATNSCHMPLAAQLGHLIWQRHLHQHTDNVKSSPILVVVPPSIMEHASQPTMPRILFHTERTNPFSGPVQNIQTLAKVTEW